MGRPMRVQRDYVKILLLHITLCVSPAVPWSSGAGVSVCVDGTPGGQGSSSHGALGTGQGGYSLTFSPALPTTSTYAPGQQYTLTLSGGNFVGFALLPLTSATGSLTAGSNSKTFTRTSSYANTCSGWTGAGLTHQNGNSKSTATGLWTAPSTGSVQMRWTVLVTKGSAYYKQSISLSAAPTPTPPPLPVPTPTPLPVSTPTPLPVPTPTPTPVPVVTPTSTPVSVTPTPTQATPTPTPSPALSPSPVTVTTIAQGITDESMTDSTWTQTDTQNAYKKAFLYMYMPGCFSGTIQNSGCTVAGALLGVQINFKASISSSIGSTSLLASYTDRRARMTAAQFRAVLSTIVTTHAYSSVTVPAEASLVVEAATISSTSSTVSNALSNAPSLVSALHVSLSMIVTALLR